MTRFRTETGSAPSGSEGIREDRERLRADNAALKQQLDVMRALAFRDQLTGLFSRHYLTDYLEQEIERMSGEANIVLALCEDGATKAAIEQALEGNPALSNPKQVFPSYFISKLETMGGLTWDGSWKATEAGRQMLALVG